MNAWLSHQEPNRRILFLVDEVGQFIGENRELMLSLQSIAEDLALDQRACVGSGHLSGRHGYHRR